MTKHMPHYIRRYRLRAGLTQGEMSHLLGSQSPGTVSHYEGLSREPDLRSALAYQVIFGVPAKELFPGIYQEVEQAVTKRAQKLSDTLGDAQEKAGTSHKKEALDAISDVKSGSLASV